MTRRKLFVEPGQVYGMLTVVYEYRATNRWKARCICDCGETTDVRLDHLIGGCTRSCGCLMRTFHISHGKTGSPEYRIFAAIQQRCENRLNKAFVNYGAVGVKCLWQNFAEFYEDMGERPSTKHTIERVNTKGHYCKENCVWTDDRGLQNFNRKLTNKNTSGRVGVSLTPSGNWVAEINKDGKKIYLGTYQSFEIACKIRYDAEIKYYGFSAFEDYNDAGESVRED